MIMVIILCFFFQAEDGIRDIGVTGVQTCALPIFDGLLADPVVAVAEERDEDRLALLPRDVGEERGRAPADVRVRRRSVAGETGQDVRSEERRVGKEWRYGWWP